MDDERERSLTLVRATAEACAERIERFDGGAHDFPRDLYGRLGFDVVSTITRFRPRT